MNSQFTCNFIPLAFQCFMPHVHVQMAQGWDYSKQGYHLHVSHVHLL